MRFGIRISGLGISHRFFSGTCRMKCFCTDSVSSRLLLRSGYCQAIKYSGLRLSPRRCLPALWCSTGGVSRCCFATPVSPPPPSRLHFSNGGINAQQLRHRNLIDTLNFAKKPKEMSQVISVRMYAWQNSAKSAQCSGFMAKASMSRGSPSLGCTRSSIVGKKARALRCPTAGGSKVKHAQPMLAASAAYLKQIKISYADEPPSLNDSVSLCSGPDDGAIALVHNGNLPTTDALKEFLESQNIDSSEFSDSRMIVEAIAACMCEDMGIEDAIKRGYPMMIGAFSILIMSSEKLIALRDQCGIRPLSIARLNGGYIIASETCAFPPIGAEFLRDVNAGE